MVYFHLAHAAGVTKLLHAFDITVLKAQANNNGAQLVTNGPLPAGLTEYVESESELGQYLLGVWVKQEQENDKKT